MLRLTDLREILQYVPRFRDRVFVIAIDGAVVEDDNFTNLLLDFALLRSLRIGVALVHGAAHQIQRLANELGRTPSNTEGVGVTDAQTLDLAITAANRVTHEILEGLASTDLRGAAGNAVTAHPAGILHGVDHQFTGRVERIDTALLQALLERDIVPVIPPLGCDGEGTTYRLNSDAVAVEVARALEAVKIIYLTTSPGIVRGGTLVRQLAIEEAELLLTSENRALPPTHVSKLEQAVRAARGGIPRVHIIDGRLEEGLLGEVFSNDGIGTLVYTNEYQAIRRARKKDSRAIYELIQNGVENDELLRRSRSEIERQAEDFYVFEVDRNPAGCVAVHFHPEEEKAELACLCVNSDHENQGIGRKLMRYAEDRARAGGAKLLFCLSTQTFNYFLQKGGFSTGTPEQLPAARRDRYEKSGRRSHILVKPLLAAATVA